MAQQPEPVKSREELESQAQVSRENALNGAASLILTMLSEPVRDLLTETAATTLNIPLWQLIAGLVQQSYDIGLFTTPVLDLEWMRNQPARPMLQPEAVCKYCKQKFIPRWPKQEFCIGEDGSSVCGTNYQRDLARAKRDGAMGKPSYPLGQEPSDRPTSALHKG